MHSRSATCRLLCAMLFAAAICHTQDTVAENGVVVKMDATITASGILQTTVVITANGTMGQQYRGLVTRETSAMSPEFFGGFLLSRKSQPRVQLIDSDHSENAVQIRIPLQEIDFLLPIHRQQSLTLDVLPLDMLAMKRRDGVLQLGDPGRFHEEVVLAIPAGFAVHTGAPVDEDRSFARYRAEAKIEDGRLIVVRELTLKPASTVGPSQPELDSFRRIIRGDQQHAFVLRRTSRIDAAEWIQSVPPERANTYGLVAYQQREYEAARQLHERTLRARPEDAHSWTNLGRALAALGDLSGAQQAYEKQIAINPRDHFAYNNLGLVQERQGNWDAAILSLRKQIEVHPGDSYGIANLPRALIHAGRWAEADAAATRALEALPATPTQKLNLSIAHVCQGKSADPGKEIGDALGARPIPPLLNNAAFFLTECGKESGLAESYIKQALDRIQSPVVRNMAGAIGSQNTLATYLDTYGWLLFKGGKFEQATGLLQASVTLRPQAEVYVHLAEAESKAAHPEQASIFWREATFLEPGQISHVPPEVAGKLGSIAALSLDRGWFPLDAAPLVQLAGGLMAGQPAFFFVKTNVDGGVESARELDADDQVAKRILPAVREMHFPVVEAAGRQRSTVNIVRVVKAPDGQVVAARSVAAEAVAIASDLAPGDFPLPEPAGAPGVASTVPSGVNPPRSLQSVPPQYSAEAGQARLAGTVLVRCIVGIDGNAWDCQVERSLGLGLDENALAALRKWRFAPGSKNGAPVEVSTSFEMNFQLSDPGSNVSAWRLSAIEFHSPQGAARPMVQKGVDPNISGGRSPATATVTFDIDPQGSVANAHLDKTSDQGWGRDVLAALPKLKFSPAVQGGHPIAVSCTMTYVRGQ